MNGVIAPFRALRSAAAYQKIWGPDGSPQLAHGLALRDALSAELGAGFAVELGMRYAESALAGALARLRERGAGRAIVQPLFPQWAESSFGSAVARVREVARGLALEILPEFFARQLRGARGRPRPRRARPDHVLFSYHGLPERHMRAADPTGSHAWRRPTAVAPSPAPTPTATARSASPRPARWPPSWAWPTKPTRSPSSRGSAAIPGSSPTPTCVCPSCRRPA